MPKRLEIPADLDLPAAARPLLASVDLALADDDRMHDAGDDASYLQCGASALGVVLAALHMAEAPDPASVLDFGAGAGRVTRWLRAAFPSSALGACDLRPADVAFCRTRFGAEAWVSGTDVAALTAPAAYDLIWVGSVLTHLSPENCARLIDRLLGWTRPGGLLVMSTSGRIGLDHGGETESRYIASAEAWAIIKRDYEASGFGYADYPGERGYGVSLTKPSWLSRLAESLPHARAVLIGEGVWHGVNDVVALQRTRDPRGQDADAALRAVAAMRAPASNARASPGLAWRLGRAVKRALRA